MSFRYGRIEGGHDSDPDPEHAGRVRVRDIARHGPLVKTEDLPFVQLLSQPTHDGSFSFNRPPLPGTMVVFWVPPGAENTGYAHPIGIPHGIDSGGDGIPGNYNIPNLGKVFESLIRLPPSVEGVLQDNRTGLQKLTKQLQESGHISLDKLTGLPSHGAPFNVAGLRNIPIQQIITALDTYDQNISPSVLSSLGGTSFSLGNLLSSMPSDMIKQLFKALPQELGASLNNLMTLMPKETGVLIPANAMTGGQINPATFFQTALNDLLHVKSFGELSSVLNTLQSSDKSGMDKLANTTIKTQTPFGELIQIIDSLGNVTNQLSDIFKDAEMLFGQLVSSMPGVKSQNLLTSAGTAFSDLINRFDQSTATEMNTKLKNFSPTINQYFSQMQSYISQVDSGSLTVAGINFGSTIQHK